MFLDYKTVFPRSFPKHDVYNHIMNLLVGFFFMEKFKSNHLYQYLINNVRNTIQYKTYWMIAMNNILQSSKRKSQFSQTVNDIKYSDSSSNLRQKCQQDL